MSARRQARARTPAPSRTGGEIPRALLIGRCIEVWANPADRFDHWSADMRFGSARTAWLEAVGRGDMDPQTVISDHAPWSITDQPERLATTGCSIAELAALRTEAESLHDIAANSGRPTNRGEIS